jgi:hypothetical protein
VVSSIKDQYRWLGAHSHSGMPGVRTCGVAFADPHPLRRAAVPFEASEIREKLGEKYEVQGIPRVVVLNAATGAIVDPDARAKITAKKALGGVFTA